MNIAIHGEKELLIRLRQDLLERGVQDDKIWNDNVIQDPMSEYMHVYHSKYCGRLKMSIYNHRQNVRETHRLTPSNYNEILNIIIERKWNG